MKKCEWILIADDNDARAIDINNISHLIEAMQFKAKHIHAKADPKLFEAVAKVLTSIDMPGLNQCQGFNKGYCMCMGAEVIKVDCGGDKGRCECNDG